MDDPTGPTGRVWVVGSINVDLVVPARRHPRPGETILGGALAVHPGGKGANQAVAAAVMGASVRLIGAVGTDEWATSALEFLGAGGVDVGLVARREGPTGVAVIVVADGENTIVVSPGANATLTERDLDPFVPVPGDVVLAQLETPMDVVAEAIARGRSAGATTILNAAPADPAAVRVEPDVLIVNASELATLTGSPVTDDAPRAEIVTALRAARWAGAVVATLGSRGSIALVDDGVVETEALAVEALDTTGAGDCFAGTLAARIVAGDPLGEALRVASAAAGLCVTRHGAGPSMPSLAEVRAALPR